MAGLPTIRWLVTRAELALGAVCVVLVVVAPLFMPKFFGGWQPHLVDALYWPIGLLGAIVGFLWMLRIARHDPEPGPSPWRYRSP